MKINLWSKVWPCVMGVSMHTLSREAVGCLLWSGWKKDRKTQYMYSKTIEMLLSCKQTETQPYLKMCSHLWIFTSETSGYKTNFKFKFILPSDRFTNNWWCQFFSLLSQIRLAITIVAIGIAMNHPNHYFVLV